MSAAVPAIDKAGAVLWSASTTKTALFSCGTDRMTPRQILEAVACGLLFSVPFFIETIKSLLA
jgi:membrane protein CcdC involved in cytochrome C biogenesis